MDFRVVSKTRHRARFRSDFKFGFEAAEQLADKIELISGIEGVEVNARTGSVLIVYKVEGAFEKTRSLLGEEIETLNSMPKTIPKGSSLVSDVAFWPAVRLVARNLIPFPLRLGLFINSVKDIFYDGFGGLFKGKLSVEVLDMSSILLALIMRDFKTASTTALLLGLGERLEEWTRRKTMANLTESLAVNVDTVWIEKDGIELEVPFGSLTEKDTVIVRAGSAIPVDGEVIGGEGMVNQVSMTGEPLPVHRYCASTVFAGTTLEEGKLLIRPTGIGSETRLNKIVSFIESSEKAKASIEGQAVRLADRIVPYSFLLAGVVGLATRNLAKVAAVLMVDYSCALKLATPIAFLSAMKEAANHKILIKGGKYLEALAKVDTVVFDKTGTLTVSSPKVAEVVSLDPDWTEDEVLKISACLEEHFPHPVARAVVKAAEQKNLAHEEEHAEVEYIVGHGIASKLRGQHLVIGSRHFVEEDEGVSCAFAQNQIEAIASKGHSVLYLAMGQKLIGLIGIEDPLRDESKYVIARLRQMGIPHIVMITGDGINDTPALSAASVGVSLSDGADLAKEVASVVLLGSDLTHLPLALELGRRTYARIKTNFRTTIGLNTAYLVGGLAGLIMPATGAVLHNATTLGVAWNAQRAKLPADTSDYAPFLLEFAQ